MLLKYVYSGSGVARVPEWGAPSFIHGTINLPNSTWGPEELCGQSGWHLSC